MRIKKKDYNEYVINDGIWVRNFTLRDVPPVDQNDGIYTPKDLTVYLENETKNFKLRVPPISAEQLRIKNAVIVSDGYGFAQKKDILLKLPRNVAIIGTNGILNNWNFGKFTRPITYYVVNHPYSDCMKFLPKNNYLPPCIASVRTHSVFVQKIMENSIVFSYTPVSSKNYSGLSRESGSFRIDDYRNPIIAAISLLYRFKVEKMMILCHADCFPNMRPAAEKVEDNLWAYPQQILSNKIIDTHLYWLKNTNIKVGYNSDGLKLDNAEYIPLETIPQFFEEN